MRTRVYCALAAAAISGFMLSCRKPGSPEGSVHLLSDHFQDRQILASPLRRPPGEAIPATCFPVDSVPEEAGGGNPLGLWRNLNLGNTAVSVLFAPPRSEYYWDLLLPDRPVLKFGLGLLRDGHSAALEQEAGLKTGVGFVIRMEIEGRRKTIFQKHFDFPSRLEGRSLRHERFLIPLPGGGRKARLTLRTVGAGGAFAFWQNPVVFQPDSERDRLNVVLVSIDTLRPDHVGAYGYARPTTPNLDALAAESAVFLNTYATSPWTLPSHVSMLSGLNCVNHRVYYETDQIESKTPLLAEILRRHGYSCTAFTGAGYVSSSFGFHRGFDEFTQGQGDLTSSTLAAEAASQARGWLKENGDRPFFLFLHTYQVHEPYKPPPPYTTMFLGPHPKWLRWDIVQGHGGRKNLFKSVPEADRQNIIGLYDGGIRYTDEALIKPLVETLKKRGLWKRTLFIVTSDHGEEFFEHGGWDHTRTVYDESIKIPLVMHFPEGRWAGRITPIVRITDILPTMLEAMAISFEENAFDGRSLIPILKGRETEDRAFTADIADNVASYQLSMRVASNAGKRKGILNGELRDQHLRRYSVPPPPQPPLELYDLAADAGEKKNIIDRPSAADRVLFERLQTIAKEMKKKADHTVKRTKILEEQLRALGYID